ncbi:MAG TPA: ABC transporter ATP-binding protein [Stellaceae bacterium]|nr:ABC transporter ATP-binding protein [Stellaceae bacterium]
MLASITAVYALILPGYRLRFFGIAATAILVALLETFGVASVLPLVAVIVDPEALTRSRVFGGVLAAVGFAGKLPPVHVVGLVTIGLFIFANAAALFLNAWSVRFTANLAVTLATRFAASHFRQPFTFFMANPPAELAQQICNEVAKVASGAVLQFCFVLSRVVSLVFVLALLLAISPLFTAAFLCVTAALYALIYWHSARRIGAAGATTVQASGQAMVAATEMYAMAREILLRGDCGFFLNRVRAALTSFYHGDAVSRILPGLPKYVLETTAVCAIFALPIYRSLMGENVNAELPVLATFAYAGFRLLPVIQQLYSSLTILRFHQPMARRLADACAPVAARHEGLASLERMPARIEFKGVSYRYPGRTIPALAQVSFALARGERVAVVGASGAGKSTLLDLLLGLLAPNDGTILIDGAPSPAGGLAWRAGAVGYVPQTPLLLNDSIARNIAFGVADGDIDHRRCRDAAAKAAIIDLIDAQRAGLDAVIGADILNFSGGERQRLAIARALYTEPSLLVLDEPGSALDPPTSRKIFELLCSPRIAATVVIVTHDLEYLGAFDKVIFIGKGALRMAGTYESLVRDCPEFRRFQGELLEQKLHAQ